MTEDLDRLRAASGELDVGDYHGAVEVYEAILLLKEGDLLATRGLALALVKLGQLDRAEEIVQEALLSHPEDKILLNRAKDIAIARRHAAKLTGKSKGTRRSSIDASPSTWIKAVHYDGGGWDELPGDETWLSDPGQRDARGERLYTAAGDPWGRPSWRVGEQVGVYFGGTHRVPVLAEIISPPEFNPGFVQAADWAQEGDGERWPWVTRFRVLKIVEVDAAPTLESLGIETSSMQQRARLLTTPDIHARLVRALEAASDPERG